MNEHPPTSPPESEYNAFRHLLRQLVAVPKHMIDKRIAEDKARRSLIKETAQTNEEPNQLG